VKIRKKENRRRDAGDTRTFVLIIEDGKGPLV